MGNSFGKIFTVTTWGESHGLALGVVIDGCPAGLAVSVEAIQRALDARRPGYSALTSNRQEADTVQVLSGLYNGVTLGTPLALQVLNQDARAEDYEALKDVYRPSHADYTYEAKFGLRDPRGGGRASARETVARVAAGAVASQLLAHYGVSVLAYVEAVGVIRMPKAMGPITPEAIAKNPLRCPHPETAQEMERYILTLKERGDSAGGVIACCINGVPAGWGEPVFDRLEADLAKAMLSIPSTKGFEIGSGFAGTELLGSEHNDPFVFQDGQVRTTKNHSGGIQGGISNGAPIGFRVAFKPVASIAQEQSTVKRDGSPVALSISGRHDPCVLPRAVPIVEAMAALVLADHALRAKGSERPLHTSNTVALRVVCKGLAQTGNMANADGNEELGLRSCPGQV